MMGKERGGGLSSVRIRVGFSPLTIDFFSNKPLVLEDGECVK